MARFDVSDFEWGVIEPLLPTKVRGGLTTKIHPLVDALRLRQTHAGPGKYSGSQPIPLSLPQPRRALLQQTQAFPSRRNPIGQTRRQLPRLRPTRLNQDLVAS